MQEGRRILLYASPEQLDDLPEPISDTDLDKITPLAMQQPGIIKFKIWINESGEVDRVEIVSTTAHPNFASAALRHIYATQFSPGKVHGHPTPCYFNFEINLNP